MKIQEIQINNFPLVVLTDTHTNLVNIRKLQDLYPNNQLICLGDITSLWNQKEDFNKFSIDFFIKSKIPTLIGNHEDFILAVEKDKKQIINYVTNKNLQKYNLDKHHIEFLESLPIGFKLNLPNGKHYLAFHNRPNDLWSFTDNKLSERLFKEIYPINKDTLGVLIGHQHDQFVIDYGYSKLICINQLSKIDAYALLTENGAEFKKI